MALFKERIVGLDVSDSGVAAACVVSEGRHLVVTHAHRLPLPPSASDEEIIATIRSVWKQGKFPSRTVASVLNTGSLLLKYFKYDGLTEEEIASALRLEVEEALQLSAEDICLDWQWTRHNGQSSSSEGILVAAPRGEVERHVALLTAAGLYAVAVDAGALATCNLWYSLNQGAGGEDCVFTITLSRRQAHMVLATREGRAYPRSIVCGGASWDCALDYLIENAQNQLDYGETKLDFPAPDRVLLAGEIPSVPTFVEDLAQRVGTVVEIWTPVTTPQVIVQPRVRELKETPEEARRFTACLGMALRGGGDDRL